VYKIFLNVILKKLIVKKDKHVTKVIINFSNNQEDYVLQEGRSTEVSDLREGHNKEDSVFKKNSNVSIPSSCEP